MIVAAKMLIVMVWFGAAVSKIGRHFAHVIPPMVSNTPWLPSKWFKRMHYRELPGGHAAIERRRQPGARRRHDGRVRPAAGPAVLAEPHLTVVAVALMIGYHLFIISTFPLAVPLEWNVMFMYIAAFLFLGFPAGRATASATWTRCCSPSR